MFSSYSYRFNKWIHGGQRDSWVVNRLDITSYCVGSELCYIYTVVDCSIRMFKF